MLIFDQLLFLNSVHSRIKTEQSVNQANWLLRFTRVCAAVTKNELCTMRKPGTAEVNLPGSSKSNQQAPDPWEAPALFCPPLYLRRSPCRFCPFN